MGLVDPTAETGFPLTVIAFMPYLLTHYDEPTPICLEAARLIAEVSLSRLSIILVIVNKNIIFIL